MEKKIVVKHGEVNKIAGMLNVTRQMVSYSLSDKKKSDLARRIRKLALQRGGVECILP